jgi:NADPH-dependent glutamate synthase beta subunit-like oxidoreductase/CO/xanthine dehydrogenase FAD-binding subunit
MRPLKHYSADSIDTAVSILGEYREKAKVVAGGTDLLGTLKDRIHFKYPETLVNLKTIPDLAYIREDTEGIKIGALTGIRQIERNQIVKEKYGLLAEAAHAVASPQLRNMGTIGGNICQEPRCWYYRNPDNTFNCTRKGGKFCNALTGENRYHSIFGAGRVIDPPCVSNCPGSVNIPSYLSRIREGDLSGAAAILLEANPIPAITGRVCPHFCEEECNRGEFDEAVSIRSIERYVGDYVLDHLNEIMRAPETDTGKHIAVIGSGPAGLSTAFYLRRLGHGVVVFDRMKELGGMLVYGIPAYRLPKEIVRSQIRALENTGIEFRPGVDVGKDITMDALDSDFDSIFLATGAWSQPSIDIEGEKFAQSGLEFLTNVHLGVNEVTEKKVVVIGGGNVALDAAIAALRLGAKEVTVACLESREEMPALEWEIQQGLEEGIGLMPSWGPSKIIASNTKVTGIELVRCTAVFNKEGHFSPRFDHAVKESIEADQILLATGLKPDLAFLDSAPSVRTGRGLIVVDHNTQATDMPGVFAGGDATRGPGTVIEAISAGRRAAKTIAEYLDGKGAGNKEEDGSNVDSLLIFNTNGLKKTNRTEIPQRPLSERNVSEEDYLGLEKTEMEKEANRCFNCGCVAVSPSDIAPALIALNAKIKTTKRIVEAEKFFAIRPLKSTILDLQELVTEIQIPSPRQGSNSTYSKFRIRQSIDFPIVSVASVFATAFGKIEDARIVLGATAPVPLRAKETEDFLKGKEISEDLAEEASAIAVKTAIPLCKNAYKIQIAKALVKRAILDAASEIEDSGVRHL